MVLITNTLYGTTFTGGSANGGSVFKINTDASDLAVVKTFSATYVGSNNVSGNILTSSGANDDGAKPTGGLVLDGSTLYGTTYHGGTSNGVVFAMQTDGSGCQVLKYFSGLTGAGTNSDGAAPAAGLTLDGDTLYGVTVGGGSGAAGNVFKIKTNGDAFADLHDFSNGEGVVFGLAVLPEILTADGRCGIQSNAFGFDITGISNQVIVVEVCTNLTSPDWLPIQTNTLIGGPSYFSDPQETNYPSRFYSLRVPC